MTKVDALSRAEKRARNLYRAQAFRNTYVRGALARLNGRTERACPYQYDPGKTWRGVYRAAWMRGFNSVRR